MKGKPWTKIGEPTIIAGSYGKNLVNQRFITPVGEIEDRILFEGIRISVVIFPLTVDKNVLAIHQFRHAANQVTVGLPAGNINDNETREEAVNRELSEETGFRAGTVLILRNEGLWYDATTFKAMYYPCLALNCFQERDQSLDAYEFIETELISLEKWLSMVLHGPVCDNQMIVTSLLAMSRLGFLGRIA